MIPIIIHLDVINTVDYTIHIKKVLPIDGCPIIVVNNNR